MHGQFCWYELTTPDVDAAIDFYPRFTGWGTQPFDGDYTMWTTDGAPFAGLFRLTSDVRNQGVPPNWMPYVESDNVEATVARATSLGGTLVQGPGDVPNVGRYAVLLDPHGAAFGVYQSVRPSGAWDGTPVEGRMSWHELMTSDHVAALAFYSALFGWEKVGEMDMGGGDMYAMYGHGKAMYGGMFTMGREMAGMHPFWLCYIHVKDVGKAVATATKAGATIHRPQMDIPGGSIAILGDPQGAGFALHHANTLADTAADVRKAATKTVARARKLAKKAAKVVSKRVKKARKLATKAARDVSRRITKTAKARTATRTKARTATRPKAKKAARPKTKAAARPKAKAAGRLKANARKGATRKAAARKAAARKAGAAAKRANSRRGAARKRTTAKSRKR